MRTKLLGICYQLRNWLYGLFRSDRLEKELDIEMQHHLQSLTEGFEGEGMSPEAARKAALRGFGNVESLKEDCRDSRGVRAITDLARDIGFSARSLWKSKGFSLAVIVTLALCIGVNTTFLSALYSIVLKPLPVKDPERVVQLFNIGKFTPKIVVSSATSWMQHVDLEARKDLFEYVALTCSQTLMVNYGGSFAKGVQGQTVTAQFFDLMGVKPVIGRFFSPEEGGPVPAHVAVLSQTAWENEYSSDPEIVGKQILIGGVTYTIIGVAPRSAEIFDNEAKLTVLYKPSKESLDPTGHRYLLSQDLWLRLKPGVSRMAALGQIQGIERHWWEEIADANERSGYQQVPTVAFDLPHPLGRYLYLMEGAALLILLTGCFSVMTLVLSRVNRKRHELSVRRALGAGRSTLQRLMLSESALLIVTSVGSGMALAWACNRIVNTYLAHISPNTSPIALDYGVLPIVLAITIAMILILGLIPVEILWKTGLLLRVDSSAQKSSASGLSRKFSQGMVVGQVAIAFIMLIGASLLGRSFQKVMAVDPGFDATQVVQGLFEGYNVYSDYSTGDARRQLKQRIYQAMQEIPGVDSVSFCIEALLSGSTMIVARGWASYGVSHDFLNTMGIRILEGRDFNPEDARNTIIIDELMAKRYFADRSPIGAEPYYRYDLYGAPPPGKSRMRIVGVAGRANLRGLEDGVPIAYTHIPVSHGYMHYAILLRTSRDAGSVIREMQTKIQEIEPRMALTHTGPLDKFLDEMLVSRKAIMHLLVSFAGIALLLSVISIYGALSYEVVQRRREIGIRSAVGASRTSILKMILGQGIWKTGLGLGIGLIGSFYLTRFLKSMLFDVAALDPWTYAVVFFVLLLVAFVASYIPARRAANQDPLKALTAE